MHIIHPYISIPYGTIKTDRKFVDRERNCISIPYGTIKTVVEPFECCSLTEFQFLMVRLRQNITHARDA